MKQPVFLALRFSLSIAVSCILTTPSALAQIAAMRDGQPTLECHDGGETWPITRVATDGKPAFEIPVWRVKTWGGAPSGEIVITAERIALRADKAKHSFDETRNSVTWGVSDWIVLETTENTYYLMPRFSRKYAEAEFSECFSFVNLALNNFAAAETKFRQLTRHLAPIREAAWRDFQPRAAAWRELATKPALSPDAERHRLLAENAVKEHDFDSAMDHYESALEIQPTWPAGWFNLALIRSETNAYADAIDSMKHYLELVPDAPDAKDAREQMIIWEEKQRRSSQVPVGSSPTSRTLRRGK